MSSKHSLFESYPFYVLCLSILIQRARTSVLTCCIICTYRDSDHGKRGLGKQSSGLRTVRRFQSNAKRTDKKLDNMELIKDNEGPYDGIDDDKSID
jgi:hypothetical protein